MFLVVASLFLFGLPNTVFATTVNVKDFGAVGDGVTNDNTAIQNAYASLSSGDTLYFPTGTYVVNSTINLTKSSITINGDGEELSTLKKTSANSFFTKQIGSDASSSVIQNLGFDGNGLAISSIIIYGNGMSGSFTISDSKFWNATGSFIYLTGVSGITIENSTFLSPGTALGRAVLVNENSNNIIFQGNTVKWLQNGFGVNSFDGGNTYSVFNVQILNNTFDGYWWLIKEGDYTGNGSSVSYSATTLVDTDADFQGLTNEYIRIMPVKESGTASYTTTTLTDASAAFQTNSLMKGEIIKTGDGAFAVVKSVNSETQLTVEEWLNDSDRLSRNPPSDNTSYTAYGVFLGETSDFTPTTITVARWFDLKGSNIIPDSETRYEVMVRRPNYAGIHAEDGFHDNTISNNIVKRSLSDQISVYGPNNTISNNTIEDGEDMGITINKSGNTVSNNTSIHNGAGGIYVGDIGSHTITSNTLLDNQWVNDYTGYLGDIIVYSDNNQISGNTTEWTGRGLGYHGITVLQDNNSLEWNTGIAHIIASFRIITGATGTTLCNNNGKVLDEGTTTQTTTNCENPNATTSIATPSPVGASTSISTSGVYSPTVKLVADKTGTTGISVDTAFSGTAPSGGRIRVLIKTPDGKTIPGITKVGSDGTWSWKPPYTLAAGEYTATFTAQDKKGNTGTTTLDFTVDEKGESKVTQVTQEETGEIIEEETIVVRVKNFFEKIVESVKVILFR